jgi:hypothetical protein
MRVVQDSDDEFEEDLEDAPPAPQNASAARDESSKDAQALSLSGTGSTGKARCKIQRTQKLI